MSWRERMKWVYLLVVLTTSFAYGAVILWRARDTPLPEVAYVVPLVLSIGISIVATIVGTTLAAVANPEDADRSDERDDVLGQRGELFEHRVLSFGMLGPMGLAMAEVPHFWIANAVYLVFATSSVSGTIATLIAYRRGF